MRSLKASQLAFPGAEADHRAARLRCAMACREYNQQPEEATVEQRSKLWQRIVTTGSLTPPSELRLEESILDTPFAKGAPYVKPPVYIDYGTNLHIGSSTFINRNFTVLDTPLLPVSIGERCLIGPNVSIYAVSHPLDWRERNGPLGAPSLANEVRISDDVWIGGGVTILPGVRIGRGCVIGAGSVVTKDIPPEHLAYGNPACVIRKVTGSDHAIQISHLAHNRRADHRDPSTPRYSRSRSFRECFAISFVSLVTLALCWALVCPGNVDFRPVA